MEGMDVLDHDLDSGIHELGADLVVDHIRLAALVEPKMCGSGLGGNACPSKPQSATGWTPPLCKRSLVLKFGSLRVRSLMRC